MNFSFRLLSLILSRGLTVVCSVALLTGATVVQALNPKLQIDQYGHDSWTSERGLPGEAVYQILQTRDGYLWVRTGSGLARFDGVRFVAMDAEIGSESVKAICIGADGDLLIRTTTRTVIYKDGRFSDYLPPAPLPDGGTRTLFETRDHVVLAGAENFIYRLDQAGPRLLRASTGAISAFLEDASGRTWIAGAFSLFTYRDGKLSSPIRLAESSFSTWSLLEDRTHRLWAGTTRGLYRLDGSMSTLRPVLIPGVRDAVKAVIEDRDGNIWAATGGSGLARLTDGQWSSIDSLSGLTDNSVLTLFEDREGSIWIGTSSGLDRLRDTKLVTFTTRDGMTSNAIASAVAGRDGTLFVFCDGGGLTLIRNGVASAFAHNAQLASQGGAALYQSRDGSLWMGTFNGLSRIQGEKVTVYEQDESLTKYFISAISEDNQSGLLVANSKARVVRMQPDGKVSPMTFEGQQTRFSTGGPLSAYAFTMYYDRFGTQWIGSNHGLYKFVPGKPFATALERRVTFPVTSIFDDHQGSLWLGGRTPGLVQYRVSDGRVTRYGKRDGLFDGFLSHVLADDDGNLWMSTEDGIYEASRKDLEAFADGRAESVPSTRYGLLDGMRTTAASDTASQPGGARTADGKLWFSTKKGIVVIDPRHMLHNDVSPPVVVESVVTDGVSRPYRESLVIAPGLKAIEFHYTALSFRIPERVRFRYQLEGYDREWMDAGSRRVAYYTHLPPGTYRFRVMASNDDGVWNEAGAVADVTLEPHFYQTSWFYLLSLMLLALLGYLAVHRHNRLIRVRAEQLRRLVEERTAELKETQQELELLAHYDALTDLPNRRKFTEEFCSMCGQTKWTHFSLLLIDFDRFKLINDTFGHDAGDAFLVEASRRLAAAVRSTDRVARMGGDEFAILLSGEHDQASIAGVCTRVVDSFAAEFLYKGINIMTSASVGAAVFPQHGQNQEELYKSADLALYEAKCAGRNNWRIFAAQMQPVLSLQ